MELCFNKSGIVGELRPDITKCIIRRQGKAVPLQAWTGPEGSRKLRFRDNVTTAQDGGKVVSLRHRPPLPPGKIRRESKSVPLQVWRVPEGSRKLRFPDFMTTAQDGGKVVSLTHRPPLPAGK